MRVLPLLLSVAVLVPAGADARPAADVVIVWAPGADLTPVHAAARDVGAAVIDRTPAATPRLETAGLVKRGIAAYDALQLGDAIRLLDEARTVADRTGGAELTQAELSDLFLYRGLVKTQQGDAAAAWDELIVAVTVAPTRVLDPARFPPRVGSEIERVRTALAGRPRAVLTVDAPAGCAVVIDGVATGGTALPRVVGPHWVSVTCPGRTPWGARVELTADTTLLARNALQTAPTTDEALIQARTAGARAFLAIEVVSGIGTARLVGIDGRERDRRTVLVVQSLDPLATAMRELLAPAPALGPRWYQSRWAWAAGAAVLAAAILVPITAASVGDSSATTWTGRPQGVPTW